MATSDSARNRSGTPALSDSSDRVSASLAGALFARLHAEDFLQSPHFRLRKSVAGCEQHCTALRKHSQRHDATGGLPWGSRAPAEVKAAPTEPLRFLRRASGSRRYLPHRCTARIVALSASSAIVLGRATAAAPTTQRFPFRQFPHNQFFGERVRWCLRTAASAFSENADGKPRPLYQASNWSR